MSNEELIEQLRSGYGDRQQIMLQLYNQNRGLIYLTVRPYTGRGGSDIDDLMQIGYLGMCEAVERYDPGRGAQFATYLTWVVRTVVGRSADTDLPAYMQQLIRSYSRVVKEYQAQYGGDPPDLYIRCVMEINQDQLNSLRRVIHGQRTRSFDDPIPGAEGVTLADVVPDSRDVIGDLCDTIDAEADSVALWKEVAALGSRQEDVFRLKYRERLSVREIADRLEITKGQVQCALDRGQRQLKRSGKVQQIAWDRGYYSSELYGGSLSRFAHTWESVVESAVFRRLEPVQEADPV